MGTVYYLETFVIVTLPRTCDAESFIVFNRPLSS